MHCCVNSMRLLKPEIIAVFKTFLPARFLRNLLFLRVWKTPQNVVNGAKFLDDLIQKKSGGYIFLSLGGLEKSIYVAVAAPSFAMLYKTFFVN